MQLGKVGRVPAHVGGPDDGGTGGEGTLPARLVAPAKLTLSLHVTRRRPEGLHELVAEMVTVDLADELRIDPQGDGLAIAWSDDPGWRDGNGSRDGNARRGGAGRPPMPPSADDNLVGRALRAAGRRAGVHLLKRIPVGGGLGGGSADAAAVLRWAGCRDAAVGLSLGSDVPFCVIGGRALVRGVGEEIEPLPFVARSFVLLVPPLSVSTSLVYRQWDAQRAGCDRAPITASPNDLTAPALTVEPRLGLWRDLLGHLTGQEPRLAGSGGTWFVPGDRRALGLDDRRWVRGGGAQGRLIEVRTVPAGWNG